MCDGNGLTNMLVDVVQPVPNVYVIGTTPADIPVTTPLSDPAVAIATSPLNQDPPGVTSNNVMD
jgi:hypothetical protein